MPFVLPIELIFRVPATLYSNKDYVALHKTPKKHVDIGNCSRWCAARTSAGTTCCSLSAIPIFYGVEFISKCPAGIPFYNINVSMNYDVSFWGSLSLHVGTKTIKGRRDACIALSSLQMQISNIDCLSCPITTSRLVSILKFEQCWLRCFKYNANPTYVMGII